MNISIAQQAAPCNLNTNLSVADLARFSLAPKNSLEIINSLNTTKTAIFPYTAYQSDANCYVHRIGEPNGDKKIRPYVNGKIGKQGLVFNPYRMEDFSQAAGKSILVVEGEKCVEMARALEIVATTFQSKGRQEIEHGLEQIQQAGIEEIWIFPDNDSAGYKQAENIAKIAKKIGLEAILLDPLAIYPDMPYKGSIDDIFEQGIMSADELARKITKAAVEAKREELNKQFSQGSFQDSGQVEAKKKKQQAIPEETAEKLLDKFKEDFAYDNEQKTWRRWTGTIWERLDQIVFEKIVYSACKAEDCWFEKAKSFIVNVVYSLMLNLLQIEWITWDHKQYVAFQNGVLDLNTRELLPHEKGHRFTSNLPREFHPIQGYSDPLDLLSKEAPNFSKWLESIAPQDERKKIKILSVINGVIKHRLHDLQIFIHLVGRPGTGKGTFARLLQKIVGQKNTESSNLAMLSKSEYETAKIIDKQLVILPDEDKQVGNFSRLKSLTGGDLISYRQIYGKSCSAHFYGSIVAISNSPIFAGDTTGLDRRLCLIQFTNQIPKAQRNYQIEEAIEQEINAITNAALLLTNEQVTKSLRNLGEYEVKEYELANWEMTCATSSIAAFINDCLKFNSASSLPIGNKEIDGSLYKRYFEYCNESHLSPKSLRNFSTELIEIANNLGYQLTKNKTMFGREIQGIDWLLQNEPSLTDILNNDGLTRHDDGLHDGLNPLQNKEYDGYDGLNQNFLKSEFLEEDLSSSSLGQTEISRNDESIRHTRHNPDIELDSSVTQSVIDDESIRHKEDREVKDYEVKKVEEGQSSQDEIEIVKPDHDDFCLGDVVVVENVGRGKIIKALAKGSELSGEDHIFEYRIKFDRFQNQQKCGDQLFSWQQLYRIQPKIITSE